MFILFVGALCLVFIYSLNIYFGKHYIIWKTLQLFEKGLLVLCWHCSIRNGNLLTHYYAIHYNFSSPNVCMVIFMYLIILSSSICFIIYLLGSCFLFLYICVIIFFLYINICVQIFTYYVHFKSLVEYSYLIFIDMLFLENVIISIKILYFLLKLVIQASSLGGKKCRSDNNTHCIFVEQQYLTLYM